MSSTPPVSSAALATPPKPRLRGVSHFYSLFVAIVAAIALVATSPGEASARLGATIYSITLVGMFAASALYHRGNWSLPTARRLLKLDHTAIFLLIAGTYTPIALLATGGTTRVLTLTLVWLVAAGGIVFEWMPIPAPRLRHHRVPRHRIDRRFRVRVPVGSRWCRWCVAGRGRWRVLRDRSHRACGASSRPVADRVRLPRGVPRAGDHRRRDALLRDRVPRAPERVSARVKRRQDHEQHNRTFWDADADDYQAAHGEALRSSPLAWGVWRIPEHELGVLGDLNGLDVLEYGCGGAQWSIALARRRPTICPRPVAGTTRPRARFDASGPRRVSARVCQR